MKKPKYKPFIMPNEQPITFKAGKFRKGSKWDNIKAHTRLTDLKPSDAKANIKVNSKSQRTD